jgi:16S rRNA A1518/A1519 N6-dimethyltransferase RsmA/KsgA/DIM1 with predicted DNA glycosylase/AP lyase activity
VPWFVRAVSINASDTVVDLGWGTGGFTAALGPQTIGVEIDLELAGHGRARYPRFVSGLGDGLTALGELLRPSCSA